ncbi:MAG: alcohol dehydrogenase catalytic domain-containing protein, partial [Cyclobacteriaceae bacterium]|nr:alcohol dehydrogenase catalytic domain-containing protein [Cyclobacteriaceae bacterium]
MKTVKAFAAEKADQPLGPFDLQRRTPGPCDVEIEILYCGVCHSDIHTARNEWGGTIYPVVPGHEIVGKVTAIGSDVKNHKVGDTVGVGCMVDSCGTCGNCEEDLEQFCEKGMSGTYSSYLQDKKTVTY